MENTIVSATPQPSNYNFSSNNIAQKRTTADKTRRKSSIEMRKDIDDRRREEADAMKAFKWNFIEVKRMDEDTKEKLVNLGKNAYDHAKRNSELVSQKV